MIVQPLVNAECKTTPNGKLHLCIFPPKPLLSWHGQVESELLQDSMIKCTLGPTRDTITSKYCSNEGTAGCLFYVQTTATCGTPF